MAQNNQFKLSQEIIKLSQAQEWDQAKLEWLLYDIFEESEPQECLCGHFPIIEICEIKNKINGNKTVVGNCCVKKFMGLPSGRIFQALKRVRKSSEKSFNAETIDFAFHKGLIDNWEKAVYLNIMRKRTLSLKQENVKKQVNIKILRFFQKDMG